MIAIDIARLRIRLVGLDPGALERLGHLNDTVNAIIALKRRIVEDLRPSALDHLGLLPTLEILAREFADDTGLQVQCELASLALQPGTELVVYRLVQEAFTNIRKHARARQVWLTMGQADGRIEVKVRDDGIGFDTEARQGAAYGLLGMRFRVESTHGQLSFTSSSSGTQLMACWFA